MDITKNIRPGYVALNVAASVILAFGLYNVHSAADITEGGVLGLTLLLQHWFEVSPAVSGFVLNAVCYALGWKTLGKNFLIYSAVSTLSFSVAYKIFELYPPLWQDIYKYPLVASVVGALFVGIGAGVCVRAGGAPSGDDALAMSISAIAKIKIQWIYLISDLLVLGLSLSYIPFERIIFSLITVILSGQIIGYIQRLDFFGK